MMPRPGICPSPPVEPPGPGGPPPAERPGHRGRPAARHASPHPRRRRAAAIAGGIAAGAIIGGSAAAVYAERGTLRAGLHTVRHATPGWVAAGVAAQCLSMAAFVLIQHRLLKAAGARLTFTSLLATDYASNTIGLAVPVAGSGMAAAYTLRRITARGADAATVSLTLLVAGVVSAVAFAVIAAAGAVATGNPAAALAGVLTTLAAAAAAALTVAALRSPPARARLRKPAASMIRLSRRLVHHPAGDPAATAAAGLDRLGTVQLPLKAVGSAFGWAVINWAADAACLAAAIAATGAAVPWDTLVLAWAAGAAAASFAPTPYGLGVVDIALITALHATGLITPSAVAAVVLYRITTFKILGNLIWALHQRPQRRQTG